MKEKMNKQKVNLESLVRDNIYKLMPYKSARDDYSGDQGVFLDANENPYGDLNRYPDPYQSELKEKIAVLKSVATDNIFIGNGSDEVIDLVFRIFCNPGKDKALCFVPSYGMYEVSSDINDVELIKLPLTNNFQIDKETLSPYMNDPLLKVIFICSPNNPTGNLICRDDIVSILDSYNGIVVVDEAYIDFADTESMISLLDNYSNLIVCQTFSKAWGLAGIRIGVAYSNYEIISLLNKVKPPYNVSSLNQKAAIEAISNYKFYSVNLSNIMEEKEKLYKELAGCTIVNKVYPSDANFFLIEVDDANQIYQQLRDLRIITRNRHRQVDNCIRVTVGNKSENKLLINALKRLS